MAGSSNWYLVRTKRGKERYVRTQLASISLEVFLPFLCDSKRPLNNESLVPLFPQYVFVRGDLSTHYFPIRYTSGVLSFVASGLQPLIVEPRIIEDIRGNSTNGVVHVIQKPFRKGEAVRIVAGPFRGFEAIFERYLSGADRVAILLNVVEGYNVRLIANVSNVAR